MIIRNTIASTLRIQNHYYVISLHEIYTWYIKFFKTWINCLFLTNLITTQKSLAKVRKYIRKICDNGDQKHCQWIAIVDNELIKQWIDRQYSAPNCHNCRHWRSQTDTIAAIKMATMAIFLISLFKLNGAIVAIVPFSPFLVGFQDPKNLFDVPQFEWWVAIYKNVRQYKAPCHYRHCNSDNGILKKRYKSHRRCLAFLHQTHIWIARNWLLG